METLFYYGIGSFNGIKNISSAYAYDKIIRSTYHIIIWSAYDGIICTTYYKNIQSSYDKIIWRSYNGIIRSSYGTEKGAIRK